MLLYINVLISIHNSVVPIQTNATSLQEKLPFPFPEIRPCNLIRYYLWPFHIIVSFTLDFSESRTTEMFKYMNIIKL